MSSDEDSVQKAEADLEGGPETRTVAWCGSTYSPCGHCAVIRHTLRDTEAWCDRFAQLRLTITFPFEHHHLCSSPRACIRFVSPARTTLALSGSGPRSDRALPRYGRSTNFDVAERGSVISSKQTSATSGPTALRQTLEAAWVAAELVERLHAAATFTELLSRAREHVPLPRSARLP